MAIKYTQVLNSFVSTEGSGGIMTNYIYYSVLVVYTDGTSEIVEGSNKNIAHLLRYVRTPVDELMELKETVKELRKDINDIVDQKMKYVIDTLCMIPDIQDKNEVEALKLLTDAGLIPVLDYTYPEGTPLNGIVRYFCRDKDNFKKVHVQIVHDIPKVENMHMDEALLKLKEAGFTPNVTYKTVSGTESGIVLGCSREDLGKLDVDLEVSSSIPETSGMTRDEACKLLQTLGYDVIIENQVNPRTPGTVINWSSMTEKKIKLYISIPNRCVAKHVDVKWTNMQDSSGDTYTASAEFRNHDQKLLITLSYTLGSKSKHQITGIHNKGSILGQDKPMMDGNWTMEPNGNGVLSITIPMNTPFEEIPSSISLYLDTQYGLMRKTDTISLQFDFVW